MQVWTGERCTPHRAPHQARHRRPTRAACLLPPAPSVCPAHCPPKPTAGERMQVAQSECPKPRLPPDPCSTSFSPEGQSGCLHTHPCTHTHPKPLCGGAHPTPRKSLVATEAVCSVTGRPEVCFHVPSPAMHPASSRQVRRAKDSTLEGSGPLPAGVQTAGIALPGTRALLRRMFTEHLLWSRPGVWFTESNRRRKLQSPPTDRVWEERQTQEQTITHASLWASPALASVS